VAKGGKASDPPTTSMAPPPGLYTSAVTVLGWYTEAACNTQWDFNDIVTKNFKLYAKWSAAPKTGGSGSNPLEIALSLISSGTNTIVLGADCAMATASINTAGAVITLTSKKPREISLTGNGNLFRITAGELILDNNITLKSNAADGSSVVYVAGNSASLTMKAGAAISGNPSGGGVYVRDGSFTMEGGEISGNSAENGGGVNLWQDQGSINFSKTGGVISNNTATQGNTYGHSVYYRNGYDYYYCDTDLGENDEISTEATKLPSSGTDFNWTKK
jgi:uncharacterized repeat protein (TIGR02543 family)